MSSNPYSDYLKKKPTVNPADIDPEFEASNKAMQSNSSGFNDVYSQLTFQERIPWESIEIEKDGKRFKVKPRGLYALENVKAGTEKVIFVVTPPKPIHVHKVIKMMNRKGKVYPVYDYIRCCSWNLDNAGQTSFNEEVDCPFCQMNVEDPRAKEPFKISIMGILDLLESPYTDPTTRVKFEQFIPKIAILADKLVVEELRMAQGYAKAAKYSWFGMPITISRQNTERSPRFGSWEWSGKESLSLEFNKSDGWYYLKTETGLVKVFKSIDVNRCYPKLDSLTENSIPTDKHVECAKNIISKHVRYLKELAPKNESFSKWLGNLKKDFIVKYLGKNIFETKEVEPEEVEEKKPENSVVAKYTKQAEKVEPKAEVKQETKVESKPRTSIPKGKGKDFNALKGMAPAYASYDEFVRFFPEALSLFPGEQEMLKQIIEVPKAKKNLKTQAKKMIEPDEYDLDEINEEDAESGEETEDV